MKASRAFLLFLVLAVITGFVSAQQLRNVGEPNAAEVGVDSAQQNLKEVSVSKFEDAGYWYSSMPRDEGVAVLRRLQGGPMDKQLIPGEEEVGLQELDRFVLGMKVQFYRRGLNSFAIFPSRPIPIEGITKTISIWVVGRNTQHRLSMLVEDFFGNTAQITMGELNFSGWKKLTVAVPPSLRQRDWHYNDRMGIKILGFLVNTDPMESYGTYYIYFDDLRAVTDLFAAENRDPDDMADVW